MSIQADTSILNRVDGSATLKSGETEIIVSVSGPIEAKPRQELPTTSALDIIIRPDIGISTTREKLLEDKLRQVLTPVIIGILYPRQLIQITIQVLQSGEDKEYTSKELSTIINATYLALIDSNIGLKVSFAAESFAISTDDEIITAPSRSQLKSSKSSHIVSYEISNGKATKLLFSDSIGTFSENQIYQILDLAATKVEETHQIFRKTIQDKIEKDFIWQL
ncbi:hypothetical protein WICMUC_002854 [Wickerhamomyces mucosus]|uniref:Exoribonuclease phosphorolytic domain-containing protein n=1 Tax=Wickerhamomyces mucosus TaxID=1378264 RepID=A0A9P8PNA0_9ASCO|nr:hypothetical protein WICMUC_002854 [Wickerhamomyces mucosus]